MTSQSDPPPGPSVVSHAPPAPAAARPGRAARVFRYVALIAGAFGLLVALGFVKFSQISMLIGFGKAMQKAGPPPEAVSTRPAATQSWERTLNAVASVVSAKGVALANDAPGVVAALHFDSGQLVKQGQVLLELDARVERAQLGSTRARLQLAQTALGRSQSLVSAGVVAQAQLDTDSASFKSLSADQAALGAQIERKLIRAPFSGKLGLRQVNLGQYLAPGTTVAVLESADADYVDFTLPQEDIGLLRNGLLVRATPDRSTSPPVAGEISAVDPTVDPATRSVKVRARFAAQESPLRPGMFLRVAVVLPGADQVVAVPVTALIHASYGDSVFVVAKKTAPDGKPGVVAEQKFVKLGPTRGDFVAVLDGVKAGEEVVSAGGFKLRNGAPIRIDNDSVKQDPKLSPTPENR